MKYKNNAGEIEVPCNINLSKYALDTYMYLNPEYFTSSISIPYLFNESIQHILNKHSQEITRNLIDYKFNNTYNDNSVLLAFSGGLDSVYQAFKLREANYRVILFHCKNMNYYTNGKEYEVVEKFAKEYDFPLVVSTFKQNTKKDNPYKKYWRENSFKNILLYSMMVDYSNEHYIKYLSSGDDLRLSLEDSVTGTNVADAREVTLSFTKYLPQTFLWVDSKEHKGIRLQKLIEYNALDLFYSCVNPGRFNQSNHNRINNKYNIQMEKYNCGVCRKCAFHSLLRYYYLNEPYSKEFIDFCWDKITIGADFAFFDPKLPIETRIKNLYDY